MPTWSTGEDTEPTTVTTGGSDSSGGDDDFGFQGTTGSAYESVKGAFQGAGLPAGLADNAARMLMGRGFSDAYSALHSSAFGEVFSYWEGGFYNMPSNFTMDGTVFQINHETGSMSEVSVNPALAHEFDNRGGDFTRTGTLLPELGADDVRQILSIGRSSGGRGGGGGGVGFRAPVFDRAQIARELTNLWNARILQPPEKVDKLIDEWTREATAFARKGGSLDFATWAENKVAQTEAFKHIYRNKPESVTPDAYMADYWATTRNAGVAPRNFEETVRAGAASGASVAGFQEGLTRQESFRSANAGDYSRRFAQVVAGTGVQGT